MSVSRPIGDQVAVFFCFNIPMVFYPLGISRCLDSLFLSIPHLYFIIHFICELFVAHNDS